ncbi:MAG: leucine-rich repeat domain-containing protein, partial [Clostridia bacterium]|nr:leucine-rich repeat domain-containing protein [Clostridia bacterium]
VVIPDGVVKIGARAFENCENLTSVCIRGDVREIEYLAFNGCTGLTSIEVPEGVEVIGDSAFRGCVNLQTVQLPASLRSFDSVDGVFSVFEGCTAIMSIVVAEGNPRFASCGCNVIVDKASATLLFGCRESTIPEGAIHVGARAFYKQSQLSAIALPQGIQTIATEAFYGCTGLQNLVVPASVTEVDATAFVFCNLSAVSVDPDNQVYSGEGNTLVRKSDGTVVLGTRQSVIPAPATAIGAFAFCGVDIKRIDVPSSVRFVERSAFAHSSLEEIVLPEGVLEIKDMAFADCPHLKKVALPHSLLDNADFEMDYGVARNAFLRSPVADVDFAGTPEERRFLLEGTGLC